MITKSNYEKTYVFETDNIYSYICRQRNVPVILCGDFNSSPTVTNGVYQFITKQLINYQNVYHLRQGKSWLPPELGVTSK